MWAPLLTAALGIWLILSPDVFGYDRSLEATLVRIIGPVIVTASTIGLWEILASARWISVFASLGLLTSPFWMPDADPSALVVNTITGFFVLGLGLLSRKRRGRYGGGWSSLKRRQTELSQLKWN